MIVLLRHLHGLVFVPQNYSSQSNNFVNQTTSHSSTQSAMIEEAGCVGRLAVADAGRCIEVGLTCEISKPSNAELDKINWVVEAFPPDGPNNNFSLSTL